MKYTPLSESKDKPRAALLAFLVFFVFAANGQISKQEAAVANVVDALYGAMVDKDQAVLENLTADQLNYGHSSGLVENKQQFLDAVMNGPFDYLFIQKEEPSIIVSGKVALARHIFVTSALNNGLPVEVRIGNLITFQKQKGQWKILGRQAYKL